MTLLTLAGGLVLAVVGLFLLRFLVAAILFLLAWFLGKLEAYYEARELDKMTEQERAQYHLAKRWQALRAKYHLSSDDSH
jgi:uncharacterized membrane protein YqaE (UPF0057 family)